jgi:hypothetical protein
MSQLIQYQLKIYLIVEEIDVMDSLLDIHGRLKFNGVPDDLLHFGCHKLPFVSEDAYDLMTSSPWGSYPFACCLSHDIDHLAMHPNLKAWLLKIGSDVRNLAVTHNKLMMKTLLANRLPYLGKLDAYRRAIDGFLHVESKHNAKGTYFFKTAEPSRYDSTIDLNVVVDLIRQVENAGHEAGFHPGYQTMFDFDLMKSEKDIFDSIVANKIYGVRQHYLRLAIPDTWIMHAKLNFLYDSSFSYSSHPGFMGGTCYPFKPVVEDHELNLWVLPLTVMDVTVLCGTSQNIPELKATIKHLADEVKRVHGVFVLLWHNSFPVDFTSKKWIGIYGDVIDMLQDEGAWFGSGRDIIECYAKGEKAFSRSEMFVKKQRGGLI